MTKKLGIAVLGVVAGSLSVTAAGAETLTVAHGFQPSHVNFTHGIVPWMECFTERTGGEISFEHFPSGQISGHKDSISSLQSGVAAVSGVVPGYESSEMPLNNIAALPGMGVTAVELNDSYREMLTNGSGIQTEWEGLGIRPFLSISTPAYQILSVTPPLATLEDMKGVKTRVSAGPQTFAVKRLGGIPVEIGSPDMYVAMQRGTVDATVFSLTSATAYSIDELIKSGSTNAALASGQTVYAISEDVYQSLGKEAQTAVIDCGLEVGKKIAAYLDEQNENVKALFVSKGIEMYEFAPEVLDEINERLATVAEDFVEGLAERGLPAHEVYETYRAVIER